MENIKGLTSTQPKSLNEHNNNKENKLHTLKEAPKKGLVQIKESFKTLKNANKLPVVFKGKHNISIKFI
jgi:hypothetical protein